MAPNCWVLPSSIDTDDGLTATRATTGGDSVTVSEAVPDTPSTAAVIVVEPASTPVANPDESMVATEVLLLVHVKVLPDIIVLSEVWAVALNCWVPPSSIDTDDGLTVTLATTGGGGSQVVPNTSAKNKKSRKPIALLPSISISALKLASPEEVLNTATKERKSANSTIPLLSKSA